MAQYYKFSFEGMILVPGDVVCYTKYAVIIGCL